MNIGIDLDSVLAYLEEPILEFHNETYGTNNTLDDKIDYDLSKIWNCTEEEKINRILEFYLSPYMDTVKPVDGSVDGVKKLAEKNKLYIITARPNFIEKITDGWVNKYFNGLFTKVIHANLVSDDEPHKLKSEVCLDLNAEYLIEDHYDYAIDCAENGIKVLLYDRPWNEKFKKLPANIERVFTWKEIVEKLA